MKPERSIKDGNWFWLGEASATYALEVGGPEALLVYLGLCRRQSRSGGREVFYASIANISAASGMSPRSINRYVALLVQAGLIEKSSGKKPTKDGTGHTANAYRLLAPPCAPQAQAPYATEAQPYAAETCTGGAQIEGSSLNKKNIQPALAAVGALGGPTASGEAKTIQTNDPAEMTPRIERRWY
jgi:hypothetical protein